MPAAKAGISVLGSENQLQAYEAAEFSLTVVFGRPVLLFGS